MLYIATTNKHKFERLEIMIKQAFHKLEIKGIHDKHIKEPIENGDNEVENALIKAEYYYSVLRENVLVEDNGIYFNGLGKDKQPGSKFKDIMPGMSVPAKLRYWTNFLEENKVKAGYIKYVFVLAINGEYFKEKLEVPFSVSITNNDISSDENILNNFMIPRGSEISFANMTELELSRYRSANILPTIKNLIELYISNI